MNVIAQQAEFGADRQFVDVTVRLPDRRPGWAVVLHATGADTIISPRQLCPADTGLGASVRFYPFLPPGDYTLQLGFVAPAAEWGFGKHKGGAQELVAIGGCSAPPIDEARASDWLRNDRADLHRAASRAMMPLFVDAQGTPCFWPLQGPSARRVAVLSIPKAGTYLVSKLLENLGMVSCHVHLGRGRLGDQRFVRVVPAQIQRYFDVALSSRLVLPGQSIASHMRRDLATQVSLHDFGKIFVYRDTRAALVSAFRARPRKTPKRRLDRTPDRAKRVGDFTDDSEGFSAWLEHGNLDQLRDRYEAVSGWYDHPDVCRVSFEGIMGDSGPDQRLRIVAAVAARCGVELAPDQLQGLLERTVGVQTQTFSGARSSVADYWTSKAEDLFLEAGLDKLNAMLGYDAH